MLNNEQQSRKYLPNSLDSILGNIKRRKAVNPSLNDDYATVGRDSDKQLEHQNRLEFSDAPEGLKRVNKRKRRSLFEQCLARLEKDRKILGEERYNEWKRKFEEANRVDELRNRRLQEFDCGDSYYV